MNIRRLFDTTELYSVLPSQKFGLPQRQGPEQKLLMAILGDAVDCVNKYRFAVDHHHRRLFREAQRWFLANEIQWPCSFERICGALDLDANAVRRSLTLLA